jgi:hypothetical protein
MGELSEDSEPNSRVTAAESGDGGSDQQERPKLVALPVPAAEPALAPGDDAPASADAPPASDDARPASDDARPAPDDILTAPGDGPPAPGDAAVESEPVGEAAPAAPSADADRLALERSLGGPGTQVAGVPAFAAAPAPVDSIAYASAASYALRPALPDRIADAVPDTATPELVQALRGELAMRAHAEAGLRARAVDAETRLTARVLLSQRTVEALRQVRAELDQLAGLLTEERARRQAAERRVAELERQLAAGLAADRGRSDDAAAEIAALRDSLQQLRGPAEADHATAPGDARQSAELNADRLSDALTRLRSGTEPIDPLPGAASPVAPAALTAVTGVVPSTAPSATLAPSTVPATLAGPFRTLCRRDPALAGQLALSLLPMQRIVYPEPVSYDILLGPGHGCVQVSSGDGRTAVARQASARPLQEVDFHVVGNPERFAKLLAAGRIRRRLGFGVARVRGSRDGFAALDALLALPLDLPALVEGGMSTDPSILLSLVAAMVRPDWTRDAQFAISHRDGNAPATYLLVTDGRRPTVAMVAPTGPIATVISCAQADLASALTGSPALEPHSLRVAGDPAPLAQLRTWIKRAQSE